MNFQERIAQLLQQTSLISPKGQIVELLTLISKNHRDLPAVFVAETIADAKRRLDLTQGEIERYVLDPTLFPGIIGRCSPHVKDGWLKSYLKYTEDHEGPEEFHFWVAVSVLGGAVRRNVYFDKDFYKVFPNTFIVLVAPAGRCRKSTCIDIGVWFLRRIDTVHVISEKITPEALAQALGRLTITGNR